MEAENAMNKFKSPVTTAAALGLLAAFAVFAKANSYEGARYATTEGKVYYHLSGEISLAASTATYSTYTITLDGDGGEISAASATLTGRLTAGSVSATSITATSYAGLPITSTAAISASLASLAATDATHTSSITALQTSTGAIQTELDAFQAEVAADTTTLSAGAFLTSTQTFTGGNTFAGAAAFSSTVSTVTFSGWVDIGFSVSSTTCTGSVSACAVDCAAGKRVLACHAKSSTSTRTFWRLYASDEDTCYLAVNADVGAESMTVYANCARVK